MLQDKVALITGSSSGIGFAIAKEFAEKAGAMVVVCSRNLERSKKAALEIHGNTVPAQLDVANSASVERFMRKIGKVCQKIDILVNNAGYVFDNKIWYKKLHNIRGEELDKVIDVDLKGSFRLTQNVIPLMLKSGGVIINISSTPSISGHTEGAPYSIAKAGLNALTKHIALEYGINNIRAYTIALGNIATEATLNSMVKKDKTKSLQESAMKRWGRPDEVARTAVCLASDSFSYATGNTIIVDGGTILI